MSYGCSGRSSSPVGVGAGSAPGISNWYATPTSVPVGSGSGAAIINMELSFIDVDGDLAYLLLSL